MWKLRQTKPTLLLGVGGPDPVDGLAAQVRVDAGVLGLGGQFGQVAATLAAVLTSQPDNMKLLSIALTSWASYQVMASSDLK